MARSLIYDEADEEHLARLLASWSILADLSFSDLLLIRPTDADWANLAVVGQVRPNTGRTLHPDDLVGRSWSAGDSSLVRRAHALAAMLEGEEWLSEAAVMTRVQCIPVRREGRMLAIMVRRCSTGIRPGMGTLERSYLELFHRFAVMVYEGSFPLLDPDDLSEPPRVGDGLVVFDPDGRVLYISPNATSAWRRLGMKGDLTQRRAADLGVDLALVLDLARQQPRQVHQEIDRNSATVLCRHLPLLRSGVPTGVATLVRDVSDLRSRDRLLTSKDATIREIHHRVKNNLQTISSLLRLQSRRIAADEARSALADAERRVRAIAVVHEVLSREAVDTLDFGEVVAALGRYVEESSQPERRVRLRIVGHSGQLPAEVATPLAVVVAELVQNSLEHGFPPEAPALVPEAGAVTVEFSRRAGQLAVVVSDNGVGIPADFELSRSASLGLSLVDSLVRTQMGGRLSVAGAQPNGTVVRLEIPLPEADQPTAKAGS